MNNKRSTSVWIWEFSDMLDRLYSPISANDEYNQHKNGVNMSLSPLFYWTNQDKLDTKDQIDIVWKRRGKNNIRKDFWWSDQLVHIEYDHLQSMFGLVVVDRNHLIDREYFQWMLSSYVIFFDSFYLKFPIDIDLNIYKHWQSDNIVKVSISPCHSELKWTYWPRLVFQHSCWKSFFLFRRYST